MAQHYSNPLTYSTQEGLTQIRTLDAICARFDRQMSAHGVELSDIERNDLEALANFLTDFRAEIISKGKVTVEEERKPR